MKTTFIILSLKHSMYVCICRAVTEQEIKAAIEGGAEDIAAVTRACRAGDDCGACHGTIDDMLEEHGCPGKRRLAVLGPRAA